MQMQGHLIQADKLDVFFLHVLLGCINFCVTIARSEPWHRKRKWLLRASLLRCGLWRCGDTWNLLVTGNRGMILIISWLLTWNWFGKCIKIQHLYDSDHSRKVDCIIASISLKEQRSLFTEARVPNLDELWVGNLSGIRWCAHHKGVVSIWRSVRFLN